MMTYDVDRDVWCATCADYPDCKMDLQSCIEETLLAVAEEALEEDDD